MSDKCKHGWDADSDKALLICENCLMEKNELISFLEATNFRLAAAVCIHDAMVGDEGGRPYCQLKLKLETELNALRERKVDDKTTSSTIGRLRSELAITDQAYKSEAALAKSLEEKVAELEEVTKQQEWTVEYANEQELKVDSFKAVLGEIVKKTCDNKKYYNQKDRCTEVIKREHWCPICLATSVLSEGTGREG